MPDISHFPQSQSVLYLSLTVMPSLDAVEKWILVAPFLGPSLMVFIIQVVPYLIGLNDVGVNLSKQLKVYVCCAISSA